jgi:tRNA threonylcarbamoyladenosine biosynthesis protein TsaE
MKLIGKLKTLKETEKLSEILITIFHEFFSPLDSLYLILEGELGIGKTKLVQLIAKNLGIKSKVTSPTFVVLQQYQIKNNYYLNHFDFFRLKKEDNLDFFLELTYSNLNIIEWGEKNPNFWQNKKYLQLNLSKENDSETRKIILYIPFSLSLAQKTRILQLFSPLTICFLV